jgi:hypothetical protein
MTTSADLFPVMRRLAVLSNLRPVPGSLEKLALVGAAVGLAGRTALGTGKYVVRGAGLGGKLARGTLVAQGVEVPGAFGGIGSRSARIRQSFRTGIPINPLKTPAPRRPRAPHGYPGGPVR